MAARIEQTMKSRRYDLVVASQWYMADYFPVFRQAPALFEEVEVGIFQDKKTQAPNQLKRLRHELTTLKMQSYFHKLLSRFGACTVVSDVERCLLNDMVPGYKEVEVIPNGVNLVDYRDIRGKPDPETLVFTGSLSYAPNFEAMLWFLNEVYPRIQAEAPGVRLTITGDHGGRRLPSANNVVLTGFVTDVRPLIVSSWASVIPIRAGGGTRLKILEAMALGTAVVATSKGAEGLEIRPGEHFLQADTQEEFAQATLRLMKDPGLRKELVENASRLVREKYDWTVIMPRFLSLAERVARGKGHANLSVSTQVDS
jgi:glycosyltransferase involved in cell wall biosynthesis